MKVPGKCVKRSRMRFQTTNKLRSRSVLDVKERSWASMQMESICPICH
jgi:hypothetical protein